MNTVSDVSADSFSRRQFIADACALGAASLLGLPRTAVAEPPPELKAIRLVKAEAADLCFAPQYLAGELLRMEGFSDVQYVIMKDGNYIDVVEQGHADLTMDSSQTIVYGMETHRSVIALAGIHSGCYELFANERIHSIRDLKGKTIAVYAKGGGDHVLVASMLAYVGIDPTKEVTWLIAENLDTMHLFVDGKADAFMAFPPQPQELRAKKVGRVIVNTAQDRPWAQYFCCMVSGNREFVSKYPVATKRALRALLKATDICAREPQRAARYMAEKGFAPAYDIALEVMKEVPYLKWRDSNPEETLRFHALRLHEVGLIKSSPQKLIAQTTDWRFLNQLKKELKA